VTEDDIVRKLAAKPESQELWLALFKKLRPSVYYSAYRACRGDRDLAADLTQDAFVRFFKYAQLERFESDEHAAAFLRQIARHRFISHLTRGHFERISNTEEVADPSSGDYTGQLEAQHDIEVLAKDLNSADRQLLVRLLEGATAEDIARLSNLTYGTAAVRIHRLIRKIRRKFNVLESKG
jgi:RNA polymerase sigma factor (sigma-70 family)